MKDLIYQEPLLLFGKKLPSWLLSKWIIFPLLIIPFLWPITLGLYITRLNRVKKYTTDEKKLKRISITTNICIILILLSLLSIAGLLIPPSMTLSNPSQASSIANSPVEKIKLLCNGLASVSINNKSLTTAQQNDLCVYSGYAVMLKNGKNTINIVGKGNLGNQVTLTLNISFDETKYNTLLAQQEEQKKQADLAKQKAAEASAQAQKDATAKALADWKAKYYQIKQNDIDTAESTSIQMLQTLGNESDYYTMRVDAQNYQSYFAHCGGGLGSTLDPVPSSVKDSFDQLNSDYTMYCYYNQTLAQKIIDYINSDSTKNAYNALDSVSTYSGQVASSKETLDADLSIMDNKLK